MSDSETGWATVPSAEFVRLYDELRAMQEVVGGAVDMASAQSVRRLVERLEDLGDAIRDNRGDRDGWWTRLRDVASDLRRLDLREGEELHRALGRWT